MPFKNLRMFGAAAVLAVSVGVLIACSSDSSDQGEEPGRVPSAVLEFEATQLAYIGSGMEGSGVLTYQGRQYAVHVLGLGVGGLGISQINATGRVYDLNRIQDFTGVYGQARTGWALANHGGGKMWLQNDQGVVIHLVAERRGVALSMGLDGLDLRLAN